MARRWKLVIIFLAAFLIRLAGNYLFQGLDSPPNPSAGIDHVKYDLLGRSLASGKGYVLYGEINTYIAPGTPFLLSIIYKLFGVKYIFARMAFCLMGAATCLIIYAIGNYLAGERIGLSAAAALAVYPMHIYLSLHFLTEIPWGFFMAIAILLALYMQDTGRMVFSALFGVLVGITAYIRPVSILFFPVFAVLLLVYYHPITKKILFKYIMAPVLLFILVIAPWTIRNYIVTDHFVLMSTNGGFTFWDGNNDRSFTDPEFMGGGDSDIIKAPEFGDIWNINDPFKREQKAYSVALDAIRRHINELPKLEAMKLYRLVSPFYDTPNRIFNIVGGSSWAILFPFSVVGILSAARDRRYIPMHTLVLMTIIVSLVWFGSYRYREAIGPFLVLYGVVGFYFLADKLKKKRAMA
jgi:4-amino-4-deoxy-L-arabinose transferase-like glycosyltransferase